MNIKLLIKTIWLLFVVTGISRGQEQFIDPVTQKLFDSLKARTEYLELELPRLSKSQSMQYFFKKRELDHTLFLSYYHRYVFDEDLEKARTLIDSRLKGAKKRFDATSEKFYTEYAGKLTQEQINQQRRYQLLFAKEKNFRKELFRFIDAGDEYSLKRAERMVMLALKYAAEKNLETVHQYLIKYKHLIEATIFDYYSDFDLKKLTNNKNSFNKTFLPLVESDSLQWIIESGELVNYCYSYAASTNTKLDTNFFAWQKIVVATSLSDYNDRVGNSASLASLEGQSIIARLDTLNREGIYKWHDKILVIGHFLPEGKSDQVQVGEAIIHADRKLLEYVRINRLARLGNDIKMGHTFLIPYNTDEAVTNFIFNPVKLKYQYMVCYSNIKNQSTTYAISKFLPPLQFEIEISTTKE